MPNYLYARPKAGGKMTMTENFLVNANAGNEEEPIVLTMNKKNCEFLFKKNEVYENGIIVC